MNLFDKIFSYQLLNRLDDTEAIAISRQERTWLKTMLEHPDAQQALTTETKEQLQQILAEDQTIALSTLIIEKAGSKIKQLYHPMLPILRKHIADKALITITVQHNQPPAPFSGQNGVAQDRDSSKFPVDSSADNNSITADTAGVTDTDTAGASDVAHTTDTCVADAVDNCAVHRTDHYAAHTVDNCSTVHNTDTFAASSVADIITVLPQEHVNQTDHDGLPYKLEYSMVKKEWYLLWYDFRRKTLMSIRLSKIIVANLKRSKEQIQSDQIIQKIEAGIKQRKKQVTIEIIPIYNRELSRILYAFSSFEKQTAYDENEDKYTITIFLLEREFEYLLSKLRFLGMRVRVIEGDYFKRRLLEASTLALKQYDELD